MSGTPTGIDVETARSETKGLEAGHIYLNAAGCHYGRIFLNSAGSSLPPRVVVHNQISYLLQEESLGGYTAQEKSAEMLNSFYPAAARLLDCEPVEVAFMESATRAWTLLLNSIRFEAGDRIITSASDYGSNFVGYVQAQDRHGVEIDVIPDDEHGQIDLGLLREAVEHPRARLVSINHIPTCGGLIQPAKEIGRIAHEAGLLYLLDACQSVGQLPLHVDELGCDMLTGTGRKFLRGPRGTGFLYVRNSVLPKLDPVCLDQEGARLLNESEIRIRPDSRCFEQFEYNVAGKVGLTSAIKYALDLGLENIQERSFMLASRLRAGLRAIEGVEITDIGKELCAIVTFQVAGKDSRYIKAQLHDKGVDVSVSLAAGGGAKVWFDRRGLSAVVRASPHYFNTEEEIDQCAEAVQELAQS